LVKKKFSGKKILGKKSFFLGEKKFFFGGKKHFLRNFFYLSEKKLF